MLGDSFPNDRIPALLKMLTGFNNVELLQARFHNRFLHLFPRETHAEPEPALRPMLATASTIPPRRSGDHAQRLSSLEEVERIADIDRETAMQVAAPVLRMWHEGLAEQPELYASWPGVVFNFFPQSTAIPPNTRWKRPGVPGEVIAYEAGLMVVGENQPQHTFTWVMAIARRSCRTVRGDCRRALRRKSGEAEATTSRSSTGACAKRTPTKSWKRHAKCWRASSKHCQMLGQSPTNSVESE